MSCFQHEPIATNKSGRAIGGACHAGCSASLRQPSRHAPPWLTLWTLAMRVLVLLLSLLAVAGHAADDYIGSWHNKKDSFNTLGFALRKDGRGIFGTAIFPVILRWERTDTGILLKISGEGQTTEMRLTYDPAAKTFVYDKPGGDRETFWQISADEPPDAETQMEERRRKEQESRPKSKEHKQEFASRDELLQAVELWSRRVPTDPRGLTAFIRPPDSSWNLSLRNLNGNYFVELPVIRKSADNVTPGLSYSPSHGAAEPELPTRFSLPKPKADGFRKWLTDHSIAFEDLASEARGPWQIEGYYRMLSANLKTDRESFMSLTRYLLNELFRDTKPPYSFSTYEPNGG
jgi:hypothetical protein